MVSRSNCATVSTAAESFAAEPPRCSRVFCMRGPNTRGALSNSAVAINEIDALSADGQPCPSVHPDEEQNAHNANVLSEKLRCFHHAMTFQSLMRIGRANPLKKSRSGRR